MTLVLGMTAKQKNDPKGLLKDRCGYLSVKTPISKVGFLINGPAVTLDGTDISQLFVMHRVVQR